MDDKVPCCALDMSRKVKKIYVDGEPIGVAKCEMIIEEISKLELEDEEEIKAELLRSMKKYNYIPSSAEEKYVNAFYEQYRDLLVRGERR